MSGEHGSPQPEPGIGRSLRRAREERGLTLQQVEQRTKIRTRYLLGLEREDFGVLPTVYVLGSLKTYADHLGLDGAGLSGQLKARLEQPTEPDLSAQLAGLRETRDEDDEYEAVPLTAVGFDQLFLGMGAVVISILVVMTVVTTSVQRDESPVSQLDEPSTPETPSEIALAGNVLDKPDRQPRSEGAQPRAENGRGGRDTDEKNDQPRNDSGSSKDDKGQTEEPENASPQDSVFDDVKFVPVSPSTTGTASPAASASPQPTSTAPASTAPASTAPATDVPAPGAASSEATPGSATTEPAPTTTQPAPVTTGTPNRPGPSEAQSGDIDASRLVEGIAAQVNDAVGSTP